MIIITTVAGKKYAIKPTEYYKDAKDLIRLLTKNTIIQVDYVISIHGTYILAKHIVTARDTYFIGDE